MQSWTEVWIESPRTGKALAITDGWWTDLPERLASRIVAAAGSGKHTLEFTSDELRAFVALHARILDRCTPKHTPAQLKIMDEMRRDRERAAASWLFTEPQRH